jgi:hypothetical protein
MRTLPIIVAAAAVAGCTAAAGPNPDAIQADQRLQAVLAGKVAGPPTNCLPSYAPGHANSLIAPGAIAFRINPGLTYVSNVTGTGCENASGPNYSLVTRSYGTLCSGDQVQIRDLQTGVMVGACTLQTFVPYSRTGRY